MKTNLKTFPSPTDESYIGASLDWKADFEAELREMLAESLKDVELHSYVAQGFSIAIKEILGE